MEIAAAQAEDADAVARAYEWLFEPPGVRPPDWDAQHAVTAIRRLVASDHAVLFIGREDGRVVGLCSVYLDIDSIRFGQRAWVEDLAVDPSYRSRGIGKRLLDEAKEWARARGARRLGLESAVSRVDAHRFYERERPDWRSLSFGWSV